MTKKFLFLVLLGCIVACEPPRADLSGYQEEKQLREPIKISKEDKIAFANELAQSIIDELNSESQIERKGVECKLIGLDEKSDLEKENLILDAYKYSIANNQPIKDNQQLIGNLFVYNSVKDSSGIWSVRIDLANLSLSKK